MLSHIRIDSKMEQSIEEVMDIDLFKSKSEFIRSAIREKITRIRQEKAIEALAKFKGISKGKSLTREQRAKIVTEGLESGRDIFKEFGLK